MRTLSRYKDDFDRDAELNSEARVVNVSPHIARFEIATTPGAAPRRYKLGPGQSTHLQVGYTRGFVGAGRRPVRATIESLTERQVYPGSSRTLPMVVHEERASEVAERWRAELARGVEAPKPVEVMMPSADGGEPIKMMVQPAPLATPAQAAAGAAALPAIDDEDQDGGEPEEPPPDHDEPLEAIATPVPTRGKGK